VNTIPVLWAARYPETDRFFVDADEAFVRGIASTAPGATVQRIDVPALVTALRAAKSVLWMAERYAESGGSPELDDYTAAEELITTALATLAPDQP
jgi:hypothetical protein